MKKNKIITITILGLLIILPLLGFFTFKVAADPPSYVGISEGDEYEWGSYLYSETWVQFFNDGMTDIMISLFGHDSESDLLWLYINGEWDPTPPQAYWSLTIDTIHTESTSQLLLGYGIDDMINYTQVDCTAGYKLPDYPTKDEYWPQTIYIVDDTSSFAKQSLFGGMASTPYWIQEIPIAPNNVNWTDFATECQAEMGTYYDPWVGNTTIAAQADGYLMTVPAYGYVNNSEIITINVTYSSNGVLSYWSLEYGTDLLYEYVLTKSISSAITVTSPTSSDTWYGGTSENITWTSSEAGPNVKLELYLSDVFVREISASTPNDGNFEWLIPIDLFDSTEYQIKITDVAQPTIYGYSEYFEIYTIAEHITILIPNSFTSWERNTTNTIKWRSPSGIPKVSVELYWNDTLKMTLASNIQNDNEFNWTIPHNFNTSSLYQIKVTQWTNATEHDFSDYFEIFIPSITITSPDSSSLWAIARSKSITWTSKGSIDNVVIHLYSSSVQTLTISPNTTNDGEFLWVIPSTLSDSTEYQIKITDVSNSSYYDYSDNFRIYNPIITIISPNSLNSWEMGTNKIITWTSSEISSNVKIELYLSGVHVENITEDTLNDGEFEWTLPINLNASTEYQIKIIDLVNSDAFAFSDDFEITESTGGGTSGGPADPLTISLIVVGVVAGIGVAAGAFIFIRKKRIAG